MATFDILCSGSGPHIPASGILGTSDTQTATDMRCSAVTCIKPIDATTANRQITYDKIILALAANLNDVAQDANVSAQAATVITQASALAATTGTRTTTQLSNDVRSIATVIGQIAQGLTVLANNDTNTKKELQALIKLMVNQLDDTIGT